MCLPIPFSENLSAADVSGSDIRDKEKRGVLSYGRPLRFLCRNRLCSLLFRAVLPVKLLYIFHIGRYILQDKICKGERSHGFHDNDGAGDDDRIVPSLYGDLGILSGYGDGLLRPCNRRCGFDRSPYDQTGAIA